MPKFQIKSVVGGISEYAATGIFGSHKLLQALDIRKKVDSLSCQQGLLDEGLLDGSTVQVQQTTQDTDTILRSGATTNVKLAQSFKPTTAQQLFKLQLLVKKLGAPTGNVFATIQADNAGVPSGTPLATSDTIDVSTISATAGFVDFIFSTKPALVSGTTYWIVLEGTYAVSGTVALVWQSNSTSVYVDGNAAFNDGTTWTANAAVDFAFKTFYARSIFTDLILWKVYSSDGNTYGFGDTGNIYRRTSAGVWSIVHVETNGKITGAQEWFFADGQVAMFWTDDLGNLHSKLMPGAADWSDVDATITVNGNAQTYPKTNLTAGVPHTMSIANGVLMISNKDWVAIVGFDGSYTPQSLRLRPDDVANAIIDRQDYGIIGTKKNNAKAEGVLYSWQTSAQNYIQRKAIPAKGINAIVDTEVPLMQAGSDGGIYYSDLASFLPLHHFPGGGQCNADAVEVQNGMALFGVYGGVDPDGNVVSGVYTLGRLVKDGPFVLNLDYPFTCDEVGMLANNGTDLFFSYKLGAVYGVVKVDPNNKAIANFFSLDLYAPQEYEDAVNWSLVSFKTKTMPAGTKIECWYRTDKDGTFQQAETLDGLMQYAVGAGDAGLPRRKATFTLDADGKILELLIVLYPSGNVGPEVFFPIDVFFDNFTN